MLRTLLVYPSPTRHAAPPLGIAYLASVAKEHGYDVSILDSNVLDGDDDFVIRLKSFKPGLIGFSVQTMFVEHAFKYAKLAKDALPGSIVVFGGPHASVMPSETLQNPSVDMCMVGEAEVSFVQLLDALSNGGKFDDVGNLFYKDEKGEVKFTKRLPFIEDLDTIPFPDRSQLPMAHYLKNIQPPPLIMPYTHMMINRGCPFNCNFCQPTSDNMWGKKVRYRSPKSVCDEMEYLLKEYKINMIDIGGDTFTANNRWVLDLCAEIRKRKIKVPWIASAKIGSVTYDVLREMKNAGCFAVFVGVESGSQKILDAMDKSVKVEQIVQYFKWCNNLGIITNTSFMVGYPGETDETVMETIDLIKKVKPDYLVAYITTPIPGTNLYSFACSHGMVEYQSMAELDKHHSTLKIDTMTKDQIIEWRDKIYMEYAKLRLKYLFDPKKAYLTKWMFGRILTLRHVSISSFKKSYQLLHTPHKNPVKKVVEMFIKAF